jgi:two-component system OmpR family response regulator
MNQRAQHVVLIVEDEWLLRMELVDELAAAGWQIREAATGEEALLVLEKEPELDFLVTDIRLGGKVDGWGVAERFRELHPDGPVVYVSANPDLANRRVPGSVFLGKPVMIETLLKTCDLLVLKN